MAAFNYAGPLGAFSPDTETFSSYCERMEMFWEANDLGEVVTPEGATDDVVRANAAINTRIERKRKAAFLASLGPETYTILNKLLAPRKPKDVALPDILKPTGAREALSSSTTRDK